MSIYRQDYCGCRLSLAERNVRNERRTLAAADTGAAVTKVAPPAPN
ncbi:MAG: epoxyqueuosine reductase QueH [Fibrobacter sp.]|nr:epoxyqueuosine reductase QueH [Fibrobacter sp.]